MSIPEQSKFDMLDWYQNKDATPKEIADNFGYSLSAVYAALRDLGVEFDPPGRKGVVDSMDAEMIEALVDDYNRGVLIRIMTKRYKVNGPAIYALLDKLEIAPRTESKEFLNAVVRRLDDAVAMYIQGWALWFIRDATGVPTNSLYPELRKRGVQFRGAGNKGLQPVYDPETREPMVDDNGQYISEDSRDNRRVERVEEDQEKVERSKRQGDGSGTVSGGLGSLG